MESPDAGSSTTLMQNSHRFRIWSPAPIGTLIVSLLAGLPSLLYPLSRDQGMFAYVADRWMRGGLPYRDAWDIKPPGIFSAYATAMTLFGRSMFAVRLADLLVELAVAALLFALAYRRGGTVNAFLAASLFSIAYWCAFDYSVTAQAESFAAPFVVLMVCAVIRRADGGARGWMVLAGLCLGTSVLIKTTFAAYVVVAAVARFSVRRNAPGAARSLRDLLMFAAASLAPILLTIGYFVIRGGVGYLVELLVVQHAYAHGHYGFLGHRLLASGLRFVTDPATLPLSVAALVGAVRAIRLRSDVGWTLLTWFGVAVFTVVIQGRLYWYHWISVLPPLALLAADPLSVAWNAPALRRAIPASVPPCVIIGVCLYAPIAARLDHYRTAARVVSGRMSYDAYWRSLHNLDGYDFWSNVEVARYIRDRTSPRDAVLVYGFEPAIYFLADRASPTRHLSTAPIFGEKEIPQRTRRHWLAEQAADVRARPPAYLAVVGPPKEWELTNSDEDRPASVALAGLQFDRATAFDDIAVYRLRSAMRISGR